MLHVWNAEKEAQKKAIFHTFDVMQRNNEQNQEKKIWITATYSFIIALFDLYLIIDNKEWIIKYWRYIARGLRKVQNITLAVKWYGIIWWQ